MEYNVGITSPFLLFPNFSCPSIQQRTNAISIHNLNRVTASLGFVSD